MKKLLTFFALFPAMLWAQTFSNTNWTQIPNTNTDIFIPIQVSGLPTSINTSYGLGAVCLKITHQFSADLQVRLQSPDGKQVLLVDTKGGNGNGYPNTCFTENATGGWIQLAAPPFNGSYFPQESVNIFNDNSDPNGTWNLVLRDVFTPADTGSFHYVNITFMMNPPADPTQSNSACSSANPGGCQCPDGLSTDCDLLPDMTASAMCIANGHQEFAGNITLSNATPNIGWGPLEIHGTNSCYCDSVPVPCSTTTCPDGSYPKELISQRIYHKDGNSMTFFDRPAGTMTYHPSHGHVHVDNWADFSLRRATPDPDARNWPRIGEGNKQSFCLVNLGDCDSDFGYCVDSAGNPLSKANIANSDFGSVTGCSRDQGIYVGNLDIYSSSLNGMGIILPATICNGDYYIVSITDPENNMLESNDDNNWVTVPISLTQQSAGSFPLAGYTYTVSNTTVNFMATAVGADSLKWSWGDGSPVEMTSGTAITHDFPGIGTYIVSLYAYNQCGPTVTIDTISIQSTVGINPVGSVVSFKSYPNPSKGVFNVTYSLVNAGKVDIELTDALGQSIAVLASSDQLAGKYQIEVDPHMYNLHSGVYLVKLLSGSKSQVIRMVIL